MIFEGSGGRQWRFGKSGNGSVYIVWILGWRFWCLCWLSKSKGVFYLVCLSHFVDFMCNEPRIKWAFPSILAQPNILIIPPKQQRNSSILSHLLLYPHPIKNLLVFLLKTLLNLLNIDVNGHYTHNYISGRIQFKNARRDLYLRQLGCRKEHSALLPRCQHHQITSGWVD